MDACAKLLILPVYVHANVFLSSTKAWVHILLQLRLVSPVHIYCPCSVGSSELNARNRWLCHWYLARGQGRTMHASLDRA